MMVTVLAFFLTLGVLIVVHEYGHYRVAVACGVKVLRFSVGFGRVLWRRQPNPDSTEFVVCALPFGGYVRMLDEREGDVPPPQLALAFNRKPLWQRAAIVAAGPLANLALAAVFALPLRLGTAGALGSAYQTVLLSIVFWNCVLAIFNLVPIPPLDGANVVYGLLPPRQQYSWRTYQQYGPFLLLLILLAAPQVLTTLVFGPAQALFRFLVG